MQLKADQLVMWRGRSGWRLFRVITSRPDKIYMISRDGETRTVHPERHARRLRSWGFQMLIPWLRPESRSR